MKHTGYTPGPWEAVQMRRRDKRVAFVVNAPGDDPWPTRIADTPISTLKYDAEANARLIADAPNLAARVERLEEALEVVKRDYDMLLERERTARARVARLEALLLRASNALDPIRHPTMTTEDEQVENDIAAYFAEKE